MSDTLTATIVKQDIPNSHTFRGIAYLCWLFLAAAVGYGLVAFIILMSFNPDATPLMIALVLLGPVILGLVVVQEHKRSTYYDTLKYLTGEGDISWRNFYQLSKMIASKNPVTVPLSDFSNSSIADCHFLHIDGRNLSIVTPLPSNEVWDSTMDLVMAQYGLRDGYGHYRHW